MATTDSLDPEPTATRHTISFYGMVCVFTARRMKPAEPFPEQLSQKPMIE